MKIRALLAAALLALPAVPATAADQAPARIAFIVPTSATAAASSFTAFKEGMRDNGLLEGKDYVVEARYADGDYSRFPALTRELMQRQPAVLVVSTIESARVAQRETKTVPIVMLVNDPVGSGLAASLARPGGNSTGLSTQAEDTMAKYVELLREVLPRAKRIAVLMNPDNPSNMKLFDQVRTATAGFGIGTRAFDAATPAALDEVLGAIAQYGPDALIVVPDAIFRLRHERVSAFALANRIPVFGPSAEFVDSGTLISYAAALTAMNRRRATYVAKILAGAKPADLPIEQPNKFELVINMKTAKALGVTIPKSMLLRADRVIE